MIIPPQLAALAAKQGVQTAWRIAKIAVPILVVLGLVIALMLTRSTLERRTEQRDALKDWQTGVVVAVTEETVPPDAAGRRAQAHPSTVVTRIHTLGQSVRNLRAGIASQNAAIERAQAEGERRIEAARRASQEAVRRNTARDAARRSITAPGRTNGLTDAEWSQL